jgi:hypothetical protein
MVLIGVKNSANNNVFLQGFVGKQFKGNGRRISFNIYKIRETLFFPQKDFSESSEEVESEEEEENLVDPPTHEQNVIISQEIDDVTFSQLDNNFKPKEKEILFQQIFNEQFLTT